MFTLLENLLVGMQYVALSLDRDVTLGPTDNTLKKGEETFHYSITTVLIHGLVSSTEKYLTFLL